MSNLIELVDLVKDTIAKGARSVEDVHKAILNQPIDLVERLAPSLEAPAEKVRAVQSRTVGSVYDLIQKVNSEVAKIAKELLEKKDGPKA